MSFFSGAGTCRYTVRLVDNTEPREFYVSTQDDVIDITATITTGEGELQVALADYRDETKHETTARPGAPGVLKGTPWVGTKPNFTEADGKWYPLTMRAVGAPVKNVVVDIEFKVDTSTNLTPHR